MPLESNFLISQLFYTLESHATNVDSSDRGNHSKSYFTKLRLRGFSTSWSQEEKNIQRHKQNLQILLQLSDKFVLQDFMISDFLPVMPWTCWWKSYTNDTVLPLRVNSSHDTPNGLFEYVDGSRTYTSYMVLPVTVYFSHVTTNREYEHVDGSRTPATRYFQQE